MVSPSGESFESIFGKPVVSPVNHNTINPSGAMFVSGAVVATSPLVSLKPQPFILIVSVPKLYNSTKSSVFPSGEIQQISFAAKNSLITISGSSVPVVSIPLKSTVNTKPLSL